MTNPHRTRNHRSPEHRNSIKEIHLKMEQENRRRRIGKLRTKLANTDLFAESETEFSGKHFLSPEGKISKRTAFHQNQLDKLGLGDVRQHLKQTGNVRVIATPNDFLNIEAHNPLTENQLKHIVGFVKKNRLNPADSFNVDDFTKDNIVGKQLKERLPGFRPMILPNDMKTGKVKMAVRFKSSFGPDLDAIEAFQKGTDYQGFTGKGKNRRLKFEVTDGGKTLKLHGHTIAQKTPKGIQVSNAGFDTGLTYSSLKELGINAKRLPNGQVQLHNDTVNATSGQKVTVPFGEVSSEPIRAKGIKKRVDPRRTVSEQSIFRQKVVDKELKEQGRKSKGELPLSTSSIQPADQRRINKITGVKSPIGKPIRATDAHHIFSVKKQPELRNNPNNAVMLTRAEHREVERLNKSLLGSLKTKLATLKTMIDIDNGTMQVAKNLSADSIINSFKQYRANNPDSLGSGVYDPIENRILDARIPFDAIRLQRFFESHNDSLGFNSITDTRQGPATDIDLIHSQLKEIEQTGGLPALGFDEGSLEALDVSVGNEAEILSALRESQRSTGILDKDMSFRIIDNEKFKLN